MKPIVLLSIVSCLFGAAGLAQEAGTNAPIRIPATEAKQHVGTNAIVTGKIVDVHFSEKVVSLNFEKPFPKQPFTAVVFAAKTNLFPGLDKLKDKTVEVSGKIVEYHDRPEIKLDSTNQLKVVEEKAGEAEKK